MVKSFSHSRHAFKTLPKSNSASGGFHSGVMLPVAFAPKLLQTISKFDPFAHAVDAARALVNGDLGDSSILIAFAMFLVLGMLALSWFIRAMKEAVA